MQRERNGGKPWGCNTHTHTHTHNVFNKSNKIIKAQYGCAYLKYKDGLSKVVCLFGVKDTS